MGVLMRGILFALAVTLVSAPAFAQEILVGGGLVYGSDINRPGIQAHGYYAFGNKPLPGLRVGGDIDIFLPKHTNDGGDVGTVTESWWDINLNAAYVFFSPQNQPFNVYGLAGFNFANVGATFHPDPGVPDRDLGGHTTYLGLNLGAGAEYTLPFAAAFAEMKYVVSTANQLVITAGLRFAIPMSKLERDSQRQKAADDKADDKDKDAKDKT